MSFNPDIHHRHSIRLKNHDYSQAGAYFVTLCVWQRECLFSDIVDGVLALNKMGETVDSIWRNLPGHYENSNLDEYVIMPNHFHGIVNIVGAQFIAPESTGNHVGAQFIAPSEDANKKINRGSMNQGVMNAAPTVGEIVRGFKARCTHSINRIRNNPGCPVWQRNYYERIIRNDDELSRAREYIVNNPMKWALDKENPMNRG